MMALTARVSCCVLRVLGFNSNIFNFGPPSPVTLNPNGRAGPKLDVWDPFLGPSRFGGSEPSPGCPIITQSLKIISLRKRFQNWASL